MIKTKPWTGGSDEEYETQHFGFGAQRLKIAVRQMVEQKVRMGVKSMETYVQEVLQLNETDQATLTHTCEKLIQMFTENSEPSLQAIDNEIDKMLQVPPNVLLPGDEVQLYETSEEEYDKLKGEVVNLRKRVERAVLMEALLSAEEEEIASIENVCENAKKDMEVLGLLHKNFESSDALKSIQTETDFLCASVPFLKQNYQEQQNGEEQVEGIEFLSVFLQEKHG